MKNCVYNDDLLGKFIGVTKQGFTKWYMLRDYTNNDILNGVIVDYDEGRNKIYVLLYSEIKNRPIPAESWYLNEGEWELIDIPSLERWE